MYSIQLKPVYSCPAAQMPKGISLPQGWSLAWHQAETWKALHDPGVDVVFNTAMTGDGKSLAAYLAVLQARWQAIGLYPTNALARDQESQVKTYIEQFRPTNRPRVNRLSGPELEVYAENEGLRKGCAIASRSAQSEVLITNPDIFHYLHRGAYLSDQETPDKLWNRIDKDFDLFILDEFHVFAAPQIASVLNTLLLIQATNRSKKFLFLSATPNEATLARLTAAGLRCRLIDPVEQGKYRFPATPAEAAELSASSWRQVAWPIGLTFVPLEPAAKSAELWLQENRADILSRFLEQPGSRGAIILNSIAAVKRITPIFQTLFAARGLSVAENTGLSGSSQKATALAADLVIGTSTIDVGIDFKINILIFESSNAGDFIQRLGRLGRHSSYRQNGQRVEFTGFTAYALVPNFFAERLFGGDAARLRQGDVCDRVSFQALIRENYRQINDFGGYYRRWGAVQSFKLLRDLNHSLVRQQYAGSLQQFQASCEKAYGISLGAVAGQVAGWAREWAQLSGKKGNPIADEAASFRGTSPLQCGLYDLSEANELDRFKVYDLPGILSNLEIQMWSQKAFLGALSETAQRLGQPIAKGRFQHCLGFMQLRGYRAERLNWRFTYPNDLQPIASARKVQMIAGLQIWQPDNPWVGAINQRLRQQGLVCYVLPKPVREVSLRLQLPMHFQLYPISDSSSVHDAIAPYSIALGQAALLIDTLAQRLQHQGGDLWIA